MTRMGGDFEVAVGAGTLRSMAPGAIGFPHRWTDAGVSVEATFTGAHLFHLAAAGCVLNDVYREAHQLDLVIDGVRVTASGGFDPTSWQSAGVAYAVEVDTPASAEELAALLTRVDAVAEIPKAIRAGAPVARVTIADQPEPHRPRVGP